MKISTQLVNLLGMVVTAAIVVAGLALLALPLWGQAQATDAETRTVTQTNAVYASQVTQLQADAERLPQVAAGVDALRGEIPVAIELDDVHEIVASAAVQAGATIVSVVASDLTAWTPRTEIGEIVGDEAASASAATDTGAGESEDAASAPAAEDSATELPSTDQASADEPNAGSAEPESPQQQATVTIEVELADATQAAAFVDALGAGPRLVGIGSAVLTSESDGPLTLVVTAYAFFRTEN